MCLKGKYAQDVIANSYKIGRFATNYGEKLEAYDWTC